MHKLFLMIGSILGALSVMIGAFGAHALKDTLTSHGRLETFETAVKYQFYHVFALLIVGILLSRIDHKLLHYSGYAFIVGIVIFSGSLYILCLTNVGKWGAVTPIGGVFFIIGWVLLFLGIYKHWQ